MGRTWVWALAAILAVAAPPRAAGQQGAEAEALAVVDRFFDGMRAADAEAMRSTLHPDARLASAGGATGDAGVGFTSMEAFLQSVAGSGGRLDERIYRPEVRVDGALATVWTYYELYVGGQLSHCGFDAFQLARTADGWKIVAIADTRRREGCAPPNQ